MRVYNMMVKAWAREIQYQFRRVYSFFIRGYHGFAPMDAWALDRHVLSVLAKGMRELAKNSHGFPMWVAEEYALDTDENGAPLDREHAARCWTEWLDSHVEWIEWYLKDDVGITVDMSDFQKTALLNEYDRKYRIFKEVILPEIVRHFDSLWD